MKAFSLYEKTSTTLGGIYIMLLVNRMQIFYFTLILPMYLVHSYMIWGIVAIGLLSQINLTILSRVFASGYPAKGYQGLMQLFGEPMIRFFAFIGLFLIVIKITVITLGYADIIHQFLFPTMHTNWLLFFILLISVYVASQGMENTIRFIVIAFFSTMLIIPMFLFFFFLKIGSLHDLYPLIPTDWSMHSLKGLLLIGSSFSGPEYLICLGPWFNLKQKMSKYWAVGNALTILEYLLFFVISLLFFGSNYLSKTSFPVVNMVRYLQSPIFERIDIILICLELFNYIFFIAILLLCFYGAIRIIGGRIHEQTTRIGFMSSCITIFVCMITIYTWFWESEPEQNIWSNIQIWLGAFTYFLVPAFLLVSIKLKERVGI
ncbi:GerAB/ArcD/ProY family transporter [Heyndrickxia acidicola]|uniref:GerAB/ArcD/ProY family transporter n=1 Tax=Heyndrickxia acidicola TaxID=209389 RepID=A0ABU6MHL3_9BACI|nr:GerAB/ArcD/ProY family transporter [Heyndrickxia acidicola]MED1204154.1 GerAB/ArcD/ProY family transporter [Heyndrickxia acidicola]